MTGITGITYCYNVIERDYCIKECIESMKPVCDQIIVADCGSTDGTVDLLDALGVKRIHVPFTLIPEGPRWLLKCINIARSLATTPYIFQLDADEVLHENDYHEVTEHIYSGRPAWCVRINFWKGARTVLPESRVVATKVVRLAPTHYWMPSDEPHLLDPPIRVDAIQPHQPIHICHYGFIRKLKALIIKSKAMTEGYAGYCDPRIAELEKRGSNALDLFVQDNELVPYHGTHPKCMDQWLSERGLTP